MIYGIVVFCLVIIGLIIYYFGESKCDLKKAQKEFKIYGLSSGFIPQGMCYSKDLNCFLISGYMKNKNLPSKIFVIDAENKNLIKNISLVRDGKKVISHFGGITSFGGDVWISTEAEVLRIKTSDIKNAKTNEFISVFDDFRPKNGADFCFVHSGLLWIGEFYKLGKYNTDISHHIKLDEKNRFHAMCYGFKIMSLGKGGIEKPIPEKALAVPDLSQGICIYNDKLFLSTSYGVAKSSILIYKNVLNLKEDSHTFFKNKKIPLHILSRDKLLKKLVLPSMSEEIECFGGRLFVLFESASKKYRLFTRRKTKEIFSFNVNNL